MPCDPGRGGGYSADVELNPRIILISGNMASGKSTVAQAVAERLAKSVHLRGDVFRKMIVNGQAEMSSELSDEGAAQLNLRYELAAEAAKRYFAAGFTVVYQDILIGQGLRDAVDRLEGVPLSVFVLSPSAAAIARREAARPKSGYRTPGEIQAFDRILREETDQIGTWLDTSNLTVEETADAILSALP